jgi:hypothetical protein
MSLNFGSRGRNRTALADLPASYKEIPCLTILICEAAGRDAVPIVRLRNLFNALDERTGRSRMCHNAGG